MTTAAPDPSALLLSSPKGAPLLWRVLSASLHLEPLSPEDCAALEEVNDLVHDWIGPELRWAASTTFPIIDPYRREDLDYVPAYADAIRLPPPAPARERRNIENILFAATFGELTLLLAGGDQPTFASPHSCVFSSIMRQSSPGEDLHTCAMLRITVPIEHPLGDFLERVMMIAARLPVRWGAAGYGYSAWSNAGFNEVCQAIYAHSRRHFGYDMGEYAAYHEEWHGAMRTVNWLTFLGEDFAARVRGAGGALESRGEVQVSRLGRAIMLRAGSRPEEGDINRLAIPRAYAAVDSMVRPVRAGAGIDFRDPWDAASSEGWLRRFERRIV